MPTILNNACINRVPKVKKFLFTSNDLTSIKVNPYTLLTLKNGPISRFPLFALFFTDENYDYVGTIMLSLSSFSVPVFVSYFDYSKGYSFGCTSGADPNLLTIRCQEDFEVGVNRPSIELHLYYFEENVNVDFNFNFVEPI